MNTDHVIRSEIIDGYDSQQVAVAGHMGLAWTKERMVMATRTVAFTVQFPSGLRILVPVHKVVVVDEGFSKRGVAAPVECQIIPFRSRGTPPVTIGGRA